MLAIIDYDAGNLRSVAKALEKLGETPVITRNPAEILSADHIILPGVGSFGDAMNRLHQYGLVDVIRKASASHFSVSASVCSCSSHQVRRPQVSRDSASAPEKFCVSRIPKD